MFLFLLPPPRIGFIHGYIFLLRYVFVVFVFPHSVFCPRTTACAAVTCAATTCAAAVCAAATCQTETMNSESELWPGGSKF